LLARREQLQKSLGDVWSRISSAYALQKGRQGRVNGDLARRERRWVKPSAGSAGERYVGASASFPKYKLGEDRRRLRVARECHSAVGTSPKAVSRSWDRGCKDHRILGRVPGDRRHPGSYEASAFTRRRQRGSRRFIASPDPHQPVKTRACGQDKEAGNAGEARRSAGDERRIATGVSEARSHAHRGKKTPTLVSPAREGLALEVSV